MTLIELIDHLNGLLFAGGVPGETMIAIPEKINGGEGFTSTFRVFPAIKGETPVLILWPHPDLFMTDTPDGQKPIADMEVLILK